MTESEPQNRRLGYARVSTYGQTLDDQIAQLRAEIYQEKAGGARPDRRKLSEDAVRRGDQGTVRSASLILQPNGEIGFYRRVLAPIAT
jgi:hypothetical protein